MEFDTITASVDGRRGTLTLNRPDSLNPLSSHTLREITAAARWFDSHDDLRVVVVTGAGRAFSAGADVSAFGDAAASTELRPRDDMDAGRLMAEAVERMRAVTIARVNGACVGGGLVVVAACDLRVAVDDAVMFIPEVDLGIPLAWGGIPRLVREIGPAMTKELVMTCRRFTPAEALAIGFLNRVVGRDDLDNTVDELAEAIATRPKHPVQATKLHVNAVLEGMVGTARAWSDVDGLLGGLRDPEGRESAASYLERLRSK
jgi:enoyl-CoA hydratase/carnithine racemase